jgi:predicted HTH domain antitoxin
MEEVLKIPISSEVRTKLNRTSTELARDVRLYAGLMLFQLGKLSSGAAAEMAGVPHVMFLDLCAEYGISVSQISPNDLRREVINE